MIAGRFCRTWGAVLAAASLVPCGTARAADAAADAETVAPGATALVLFVSYRGLGIPDLSPTWVRRASSADLAEVLAERDRRVVTAPDLEPLLQERRIRSVGDVDADLVRELARTAGADRVVVGTLTVYRDRIHLVARGLLADGGGLAWADAVERALPAAETAEATRDRFRAALREATRSLRVAWTPPASSPGTPLVVLPMRSEGTDPALTDLVTSCVLRSLISRGRWTLPDPALAASTMRGGGFHPLQMEEDSRRLLADRFGTTFLLVPRLVPFPAEGAATASFLDDDDDVPGIVFELGTGVPYLLSLAMIDCETGKVLRGADVYLAPESGIGIFGRARRTPAVQRFERGVDQAVASLIDEEGTPQP